MHVFQYFNEIVHQEKFNTWSQTLIIARPVSLMCFVTDHVRSTREGNVFRGVCLSVHKGELGTTRPGPIWASLV